MICPRGTQCLLVCFVRRFPLCRRQQPPNLKKCASRMRGGFLWTRPKTTVRLQFGEAEALRASRVVRPRALRKCDAKMASSAVFETTWAPRRNNTPGTKIRKHVLQGSDIRLISPYLIRWTNTWVGSYTYWFRLVLTRRLLALVHTAFDRFSSLFSSGPVRLAT